MVSVRARLMGLLLGGFLATPLALAQQTDNADRPNSFVAQSGGLLGRLSSRGKAPQEPEAPKPTPSVKPAGGILGRIFSSSGESSSKSSGAKGKDDDGRRVIEPVPHSETPDWDGVPFHKASPIASQGGTSPLNDPKDPSNLAAGSLRAIAGNTGGYQSGSSPSKKNVPAPTNATPNAANATASASKAAGASPAGTKSTSRVPVPPTEKAIASQPQSPATPTTSTSIPRVATVETTKPQLQTSNYLPPSSTESSRRSRRKAVDPLEIALDRHRGASDQNASDRDGNGALANGEPSVPRQRIGGEATEPVPSSSAPELAPPPTANWEPAQVAVNGKNESGRAAPGTTSASEVTPAETTRREPMVLPPATSLAAPVPRTLTAPSSDNVASVDSVMVPKVGSTPIVPSIPTGPSTPEAAPSQRPTFGTPAAAASVATNGVQAPSSGIPETSPQASSAATPLTAPAAGSPELPSAPSATVAADLPGRAATESGAGVPAMPRLPDNQFASSQGASSVGIPASQPAPSQETVLPGNVLPGNMLPGNMLPGNVLPGNVLPGNVLPGNSPDASAAVPGAAGLVSAGMVSTMSDLPGLRVTTIGPVDVTIRKPITYSIVVENRGAIDAPGAAIQVKLPPWVELITIVPTRGEIVRQNDADEQQLLWVVEGLPSAGQEKLQVQLVAKESREFNVDVEWAVVPQSSIARVSVREPKLQLVIEGPESVVYGQSANYRVRVLNPGNGVAENVVFTLSPNSATPQSQKIGQILPGEEAKFDVELTARDLEALQIHGLATGDLEMKVEQIKTIQVTAAQLYAALSGPALKYQDSIGNFKIELANQGTADATNVDAVLELPVGIVYQGGIENAQQEGQILRWKIAKLGMGEKVEYPIQCMMQKTGLHTLAFSCQGTAAANTSVQFQTQVDALADLVLTINDPQAPAPTQQEVTYEIVIRNRGSKAATDVIALAQFGNDIEPIRVEGGEATFEPGQVLFSPIEKIEAGQTVVLRVIAKADKPGLHRFRSEVRCSDTLLIAEEATRYLEAVGQRVSRSSSGIESR